MTDPARRATASGLTFTSPVTVPGTSNADAEAPQVARSGDSVFLLWHEFPDATAGQPDVFLARSANRGASFGARFNLSGSPATSSAEETLAVTRSGTTTRVYVVWNEDGRIQCRRDRTNDGTFAPAVRINDTVGTNGATRPRVVASGDRVYVVWQAEGATGVSDIFFARSVDAGSTFRDKQNVSKSPGDSFDPALTLAADDSVIVAWRDGSAGDFEIRYARGR